MRRRGWFLSCPNNPLIVHVVGSFCDDSRKVFKRGGSDADEQTLYLAGKSGLRHKLNITASHQALVNALIDHCLGKQLVQSFPLDGAEVK
jgi:hypothetical protein